MKKQVKNHIFKSVLLLVSVVAVITSIAIFAFAVTAIEEPTSEIELIFEDNRFHCYIETRKNNSSPWEVYFETQVGGVFAVPYAEQVRLRAVANTGEWANFDVNSETVYNVIDNIVDNTVVWATYKYKATVTITCVNRTYKVLPLSHDLTGEIGYATLEGHPWTIEDWKKGNVSITYQYGTETELPTVRLEDHTFKGWNIVMGDGSFTPATKVNSEGGEQYFIPQDLSRTTYFDEGIIYVYPDMQPFTYPAYRQDVVWDKDRPNNLGDYLFGIESTRQDVIVNKDIFANAENFWADEENGFKQYIGYLLMTEYNHSKQVKDSYSAGSGEEDKTINTVYRYYAPIEYKLNYYLNADGDTSVQFAIDKPETYTYANTTYIGKPTRTGYTFLGWRVEVYTAKDGWVTVEGGLDLDPTNHDRYVLGDKKATYDATTRNDPNAKYASEAQEDGSYEIRLTADWVANTYDITYNWGDGVSADLIQNKADLPASFTFAAPCSIPNPVRAGYTFAGWTLTYTESGTAPEADGLTATESGYTLDGSLHAAHITLTAAWEVESYTVILDGQGATNEFTATIPGVQYDAALVIPNPESFVVPTKKGYDFVGYYNAEGTVKYINADGTSNCGSWDIDGENNGTVTLYAKWEIKYFNITIEPIQKVPAGVEITIIETATNARHPYTGEPISLPYQTEFKVEIVMPDGFKIFEWNGIDLSKNVHSGNTFVSDPLQLGAEDMTLIAQACPAAPQVGVGYDIDINVTSETEIQVNFANADLAKLYEVAIALRKDETNLDWKLIASEESYYAFTGLNPGTTYFVFIRLHQTEYTWCGIAAVKEKTTHFIEYVKDVENLLKDMVTDSDGDCVKALIEQTIQDIYDLIPKDGDLPADFYQTVENMVAAIEAKLAFARLQDSKIAALEKYREECMLSGSFTPEHKALINSLCATAVANISGVSIDDENAVNTVEEIYNTAKAAIEAIPVTYLYDASGMMQLTTLLGLHQNSGIALNSIQDINALRRAISDAIAAGKITADSFITVEEAKELLRTLDTVSAYSFYLINVQPTAGDTFTFTLTIPEALAGRTGLQVAYYNAATGMVELLETTVDGNKLIFRAKQVSDFVILADPTVDLTGVIIALGVIVLCQIIAIALVLAARSRAKNAVQHASLALPTMFLTIHFLPVNAELIALGLGIAALILQIVLMWLLISSGMIRVFKTTRRNSADRPVTPAVHEDDLQTDPTAVFDEEPVDETAVATEEFVEQENVEQEDPTYEAQPIEEEEFDAELAQEAADEVERERIEAEAYEEQTEDETVAEETEDIYDEEQETVVDSEEDFNDEFSEAEQAFVETDDEFYDDEEQVAEENLDGEIEEVYDDEEFVEHPTEPYYALDEEEDEYAHTEEETERVSDVDTADQETEETSYGADPLDGVFGEADVQDGDTGDEGRSSSYEDSYGEPHEYGDETDSQNAEAEDADREETSGEGSIDPASYIVNEEEAPEDESMYQYDE